ncbi:trypsin-like peptidase domain-containing protein [Streptomyces sp. NA04227]|uniref:trypsin-like peptidase domain-containing protein n=1 Tax=Streptomyces sp. NA04227 TaxID=2742136 RepID=UPI001590D48C|nr:trypsin-like peptidase domain-containing protein [Streptomyces sp. NA04227]QKW08978.1 trypsin-like peptidase domain-containing protein [Streptomyces sp. NA04227]
MDEQRPAKAKWWSRPRPETVEDTAPTAGDPAATHQGAASAQAPGRGGGGAADSGGSGTAGTAADAVASPDSGTSPDAGTLAGTAAEASSGPNSSGRPSSGGASSNQPSSGEASPADPAETAPPGHGRAHLTAVPDPTRAQATASAPAAEAGAGAASAERPKPLHDPDPYSTPPYGEPGPWAPAPPVQHPTATPAHGTVLPQPHGTNGLGTPIPTPAQGTPAHGTQVPGTPTHGTQVPGTPTHGTQVPGTPAHGTAVPGTPAHGTSVHGAAGHGTPGPYGGAHPTTPQPQPQPQAMAHHTQAAPAPVPHQTAPQPQPQPHQPHQPHQPQNPAAPQNPGGAADPWQNYDPWYASRAPLQQTGAATRTEQQRKKRGIRLLVVWSVTIALISGTVGGLVGTYLERNGGVGGGVELTQSGEEPKGRAPGSVAGIAAKALPGVVTMHVNGRGSAGTGTGFVLDGRGHILTNNHVVEPAGSSGEITVTFSGGQTAKAEVVGRDSGYDLAVVRVRGVSGLRPLPLGNSDNVQVGDPVVAIGAPFDLANTVTSGIISAKERPITAGGEKGDGSDISYVDALQTDAPINPGNSGGPLMDSKGRVIGINSAIRSADNGSGPQGEGQSGSIGLGFAIPVNQGKRVAEELINTGKATHPVIGVTLDMNYAGDGARVRDKDAEGSPAVVRGGPGDKAGIEPGDLITAVDGQRVHSGDELIVKIRAHRPEDRLKLTVERDGRQREVSLVLGSADGE